MDMNIFMDVYGLWISMYISMDIHGKSVDMDMDIDGKFHIHDKPANCQYLPACEPVGSSSCEAVDDLCEYFASTS